jgi:ribosome-associated protein
MAVKAAEIAIDKKANDTLVLQLKDLSTIADYLVICSGDNPAQVKAIADAIDEHFSKQKIPRLGREGMEFARWVLIDYGDFIVNIFNEDTRAFYELEKMWIDAPRVPLKKDN